MKIITFDPKQGIYNFELDELETEFYAHPAIEIIFAKKGHFSVETTTTTFSDIDFIIIDSNVKHRVFSDKCEVQLLMLESHNSILPDFLKKHDIEFHQGISTGNIQNLKADFFQKILKFGAEQPLKRIEDERVRTCVEYFEEESFEYHQMIETLKSKVFLSESRLSHLFKEKIGMSLKKYAVWCRLKKIVPLLLDEGFNLRQAADETGFHDLAHLSKSFKNILGISPSKAYNSSTVQI